MHIIYMFKKYFENTKIDIQKKKLIVKYIKYTKTFLKINYLYINLYL